jgi:hypothetical protein
MTTIAYRDGVMACDSCWALNGSLIDNLANKIIRLKSGGLFGLCGSNDVRPIIRMLENVKTEKQMPSYEELAAVRISGMYLLVLPNRRVFKFQTTALAPDSWEDDTQDIGMWRIELPFVAVGSGAELAIGAMAHGANAQQAVRAACRFYINSRLPVHTHDLTPDTKARTGK